MSKFRSLFSQKKCAIIGMLHVGPLPGAPLYNNTVDELVEKACTESQLYLNHGIDGLLVENMRDIPYIQARHFTPEVVATMTRICSEVRRIIPINIPLGIQVLATGNREAIAIAKACNLNFIRAEGFVFSHVADEGFTDADAGVLLRYRRNINADNVMIFTDIKKKHSSHAITGDLSLAEVAKAAEFFLSDGLILTGTATGDPADVQELCTVKSCSSLPILIGSGVTIDNVQEYLNADALIIGSHFKKCGKWNEELSEDRIKDFISKKTKLLNSV